MTPKFIDQKKTERMELAHEIMHEFMECDTVKRFNELSRKYHDDIRRLHLHKSVSDCLIRIKRVNAL